MLPTVRIIEIDIFRGIAILLMIIFHFVFDLAYFYNWPLDYLQGFWYYQGKTAAILFMLLSGISSTLSRHPCRRGLTVLGAGLLITAVTYYYDAGIYIRFGILHLLGLSMLLAPWLVKRPAWLLMLAGSCLVGLGSWAARQQAAYSWLLPLGLRPAGFSSLDYYPLLPWLGVILYGMAAGRLLYPHRQPLLPAVAGSWPASTLSWLGRQSLLIYLVHQPLLLVCLALAARLAAAI